VRSGSVRQIRRWPDALERTKRRGHNRSTNSAKLASGHDGGAERKMAFVETHQPIRKFHGINGTALLNFTNLAVEL
jgi:hypothetical protein